MSASPIWTRARRGRFVVGAPLAGAALAALFAACASRSGALEPASRPAEPKPAAVKSLTSDLPASDPAAAALAAEVVPRVEAIRGLRFRAPVRTGVLDQKALAEQLEREFAEEVDPESLRAQGIAFELLGLAPEGLDLLGTQKALLLEEVSGFYDAKRKQLFLTREDFAGPMAKAVMVHELCHALDDQHFDLNAHDAHLRLAASNNDDRGFAYMAATEGSAMLVMGEWLALAAMEGIEAAAPDVDGDDSMDPPSTEVDGDDSMTTIGVDSIYHPSPGSSELLGEAPSIVVVPLALAYMGGEAFYRRGDDGRVAAKDWTRALTHPPLSSEQILHPEKYWDLEALDEPVELRIPDLTAELGPGWRRAGENVLGELGVMVLTTADAAADPEGDSEGAADGGGEGDIDADFDAGPVPSTPEASGWDGDLYVVYEGPAGADGRRAAVVVWASVWDTPDDAFEILQYLEARGESAPSVAQRSGARLVAVFARGAVKDAILEKAASRALAELETRAPSRRGP